MPNVPNALLQHYVKLTEFLGQALGPDYEVALHDLTDKNRSIIAIANNHVSGREIGAPLTNVALSILRDKSYETSDYRLHYYGVSVNGKDLRSSTMFIKQNGRLIGMLCINFDDSRYRALSNQLMGLCHPDIFVEDVVIPSIPEPGAASAPPPARHAPEKFRNSTEAVAIDAINRELERLGVTADRLTSEERLKIINALETNGIFLLKGAVKDVAAGLHCSQASVYRYLSQVKSGSAETQE
ncbi:helix-turn-helix transcriptional regulator [Dysosmobacter sp.]|uniref:helix-turn-helix transcriptional regulator n=1 Tax=Dysosmobacter sp. TaxID=2591382 RepID=UPI002A9C89BA|nr:PAS domain-containing protein [Dysosmobacter sp.]MDY5612634.1 PAS domain-containing protein [Dysosmobacter sp.]